MSTPSNPQTPSVADRLAFVEAAARFGSRHGCRTICQASDLMGWLKIACAGPNAAADPLFAAVKAKVDALPISGPKTLQDQIPLFADVLAAVTRGRPTSAAALQSAIATPSATKASVAAPPTPRPHIPTDEAHRSDEEHLAVYAGLQGAGRRAYFGRHGAAIWRAHERAARTAAPAASSR